jgi:iron complex outermembrane receptor protein
MKTAHPYPQGGRLALTALALACSALAHAQATDTKPSADTAEKSRADAEINTLQTVTVTASRRAEPLKTAPISATVLSGDDLARAGVSVLEQLQFATPSAAANNFGQGLNVTIRGIGKAETNTQTTTGVITYRDGVATSPGYFSSEPYYDIASVQILRGPQGTFGGQNATGGAVLVDSNDPVIRGGHQGYLLGQVGNYKDLAAQGAVNMPISDTLAARFAFNTQSRDSVWTITGPYTGGNGQLRTKSGRIGLLWKPTAALTVLLKTDYNDINMGAYPADPVSATNDPFIITANADQKARDRFGRSVLKVEYGFDNGVKLRSLTGYQRGNTVYAGDLDGTSAASRVFIDSTDETLYSQEFNLISPDAGPLTWVAGVYANRDTFTVLPGNLVTGVLGNPATEYRFDGSTPRRTRAVFGQVGVQLSDQLKLVVEGRYSKTHHSLNLDILQYGLALKQRQSVDFNGFSGKVALNWALDAQHFLYGFIASANRPGGLNVPVGLGEAKPFDAEKVTSAEAGWKASWLGGRVNSQTSVFYNHYRNFQVTIGYPTFPVFGVEVNTPNPTRIYGLEQQVQAQLGDGWSARLNLGLLHSALGLFYATDPRVPATATCDPQQGPASASCVNLKGHKQTYAPELTLNLGVERRFFVGSTAITPRLNIAHVGAQWATLFEKPALGDRLGSRNLVGAQIDVEHGDMLATLYSSNLTDTRYISAITAGLRLAGAPRQYGVRLTKFF